LLSVKRNQSDKDKGDGVVHDMHHPGEHYAPLLVNKVHPNNTNIKNTNLNNVNRASREEVVENSGGEIKENTVENEGDINDIRRKIKESLKDGGKCNFTKPKDPEKEEKLLKSYTGLKENYSNNNRVEDYPMLGKYRSREKELLAREIAEEVNDNHSLGAFRAVANKIPEQKIRIFLSIIKDAHLTGKIKKSRGAMFISLAKAYAGKNNINLNFR
jgi:hypothetical protein